MTKGPSPLLGYNTNVRHKGRVFHIQTEDSGISHPHVITHLFADGGRILKSNKTTYAELVSAPDMVVQVKRIMQDQHKAMFIALRDGQFDHLVEGSPLDNSPGHGVSSEAALLADLRRSQSGTPSTAAVVAPSTMAQGPKPPGSSVAPPPTKPAPPTTVGHPAAPVAEAVRTSSSVAMPAVKPPSAPSADSSGPKPVARPSVQPRPATPSQRPAAQSVRPPGQSGHYQPVRAPEILGSFKSRESTASQPANIFGDGLMSEKSLDEVILAYLSEDLDEEKR
jgi:hypothetical protein